MLKDFWMPSYNRLKMLRFMAQLLHPTALVDDSHLPAPQVFWDRLVQLGSSQLVLPAIYGALKRKKIQQHTPKDLVSYLQEITDLNYKRNSAILKQIAFLSKVFKKHQIEHVFLKGAAMLITKPYESKIERMVGDIDILVLEKDLLSAQQLLINEGFDVVSNEFSFTKGVFSENHQKHLKRIAHPNYIAAVELHRHLLGDNNNLITPQDVLENKLQSPGGYSVPSKHHLWLHAILNWQYNDSGMTQNILGFRSVVDVLFLEPYSVIEKLKTAPKAVKHFYSLLSLYFDDYSGYYPFKKLIYKWQLSNKFLYKLFRLYAKLNALISIGLDRLLLLISSKTYRQKVLFNPRLFINRILNFWNR